MANVPAPQDEWEPDPPSADELRFDEAVGHITCVLASMANQSDRLEAASTLVHAHDCFERVRREHRRDFQLSAMQRDALLEGLDAAWLRVEQCFAGKVSGLTADGALIVDGIRAFQALAVHFAKEPSRRTLPADRVADLIAHLRLGHNAIRDIELRAGLKQRAQARALSTLAFVERSTA